MPKSDDNILEQEIGKVGALGGKLGGAISGVGNLGSLAGNIGGIVGAKLLPTQEFEMTIKVAAHMASVVSALTGVLASDGQVLGSEPNGETVTVKGLVHSGFFNMNPAILIACVEQAGTDATTIVITGKAKEGLIKQHTAEKAARRIVDALFVRLR